MPRFGKGKKKGGAAKKSNQQTTSIRARLQTRLGKNKSRGLKDDLSLKYWLLENSRRDHCWIIHKSLEDILKESTWVNIDNNLLDDEERTLNTDTLLTVYGVYMTLTELFALVESQDGNYYLIHNLKKKRDKKVEENADDSDSDSDSSSDSSSSEKMGEEPEPEKKDETNEPEEKNETDEGETDVHEVDVKVGETKPEEETKKPVQEDFVKSVVIKSESLYGMLRFMSDLERKKLMIDEPRHMKLTQTTRKEMASRAEALWKLARGQLSGLTNWIAEQKEQLELDHFIGLTDDHLMALTKQPQITSLKINQNVMLKNFNWLDRFPALKSITIINCPELDNDMIGRICKILPKLTEVYIHHCPKINFRIFVDLIALKKIETICVNQLNLVCQQNVYHGLIKNEEWEDLCSQSLTKLFINSSNMTLDVINFVVKACPALERFIINHKVFSSLQANLEEEMPDPGVPITTMTFASIDRRSMEVKRPFRIKNMLKDQYDEPFSDQMRERVLQRLANEQAGIEDEEMKRERELEAELEAEVAAELEAEGWEPNCDDIGSNGDSDSDISNDSSV